MSPPKAPLKRRAVDPPTAASESRAAPAPTAARRLGNGQMLTVLRARQAKASDAPSNDATIDQSQVDPWSTLSAGGRKQAQSLYEQCSELIGALHDAQTAHVSVQRTTWINFLAHDLLIQIGNLDGDAKIAPVEQAFTRYVARIADRVVAFDAEWVALEARYRDERDWLARRKFDDATLAAKRLDDLYNESRHWLDGGALAYITDEDYGDLKRTLDKHTHISTGVLQGSRIRARDVHDLLDVVRELRLDEQDPDKYAPGWRKQVDDELDNLERLAKRTPATPGTDFAAEFIRLRNELREQRDAVLQKRPLAERVAVGVAKVPIGGAKAVVGAAEAIVGPFVEAARELYDEAQVGLYYVSGGRYMPTLTSDLLKAFERGATRTEVLKSLVTGIVETPKRLLTAVENGDWEAVGREAVNLYLFAKVVKESPQYLRRVPEILVKTRRALRALKARTLGLRLQSSRLTPPPVPREPVFLRDDPAVQPTPPASPRYGPTTTPPRLPAAPTYLTDPPGTTSAPIEAPQADNAPAPRAAEPVPMPDVGALRTLFLRLLRTGERGEIVVGRVGFGGIRAWVGGDRMLTVYRDSIINVDRIPDQGKLLHRMFEEAAQAAARESGAASVRVAIGTVQNQKWAAYLRSIGYDWDFIQTPAGHSQVLFRTFAL